MSILQSIMRASELGLDCSGTLGQGYLVPFNTKVKEPGGGEHWEKQAQFMPGYRGLIELARRSGQINAIRAECVFANDHFDYELGLNQKLVHKPYMDGDRGTLKAVYAVATFKDGSHQFEVMFKADVDRIRKSSKAGNSGPWVQWYDEMARKTVVRKLCKYLPQSPELEKAMQIDAEIEENRAYAASVSIDPRSLPASGVDRVKTSLGLDGKGNGNGATAAEPPASTAAPEDNPRDNEPDEPPAPEATDPEADLADSLIAQAVELCNRKNSVGVKHVLNQHQLTIGKIRECKSVDLLSLVIEELSAVSDDRAAAKNGK